MTFTFSKDPMISYIQQQTRIENQCWNQIFAGTGGAGKSYAALEYCRLIDPDFSVDRVVWTEEDFLDLLDKELPPGSCLLWDEAGIGLDSRDFMTLINKILSYIITTIRYRRQIMVLTTPSMNWTDLKAREMLHGYCEMLKRFHNNRSLGKFYMLQTNYFEGKTYRHLPRIMRDGIPYVVRTVEFNLPPKSLTDEYEARKKVFGANLLQDARDVVRKIKGKELNKGKTYQDMVDEVKGNRDDFTNWKGRIDMAKVQLRFNLSPYKAKALQEMLVSSKVMRSKKQSSV